MNYIYLLPTLIRISLTLVNSSFKNMHCTYSRIHKSLNTLQKTKKKERVQQLMSLTIQLILFIFLYRSCILRYCFRTSSSACCSYAALHYPALGKGYCSMSGPTGDNSAILELVHNVFRYHRGLGLLRLRHSVLLKI